MKRKPVPTRVALSLLVVAVLLNGSPVAAQQAIQVRQELPEESLLDVAIEVLDAGAEYDPGGVPPKQNGQVILPEVRAAEARFVTNELKETLQSTGQWGAVRVVPPETGALDLVVSGKIIKSNGKDLVLEISASDSSGRDWLEEKRYKQVADLLVYGQENAQQLDPFHGMYAQIANDLLAERQKRDVVDLLELRQISELRFASDVAPEAFTDYLTLSRKGRYKVSRLPAEDDPMLDRVNQIRERDYMFVDTLNEFYAEFCLSMEEPYDNWRAYSYEEELALEQLRRQARNRRIIGALAIFGAVVAGGGGGLESVARDVALLGGIAAIQSGNSKAKEAKIHKEALRELGSSFGAEVAPMIVEIEGETVRLSGSREDQYAEWRRLLRQIYASETGVSVDPNSASDLSVESTTGN